MALILNLETATTVCSVSLAKDGELIALKEINGDYSHAENLTLFIEDVFKQAGLKPNSIDAVAVSKGPGSYTGLRIGVSTAKGLCYSLDKPLIAINTLEHTAHAVAKEMKREYTGRLSEIPSLNNALLCPMIDARRMEVYCALFDRNNKCIMPTKALIIDGNSFSDYLKENKIFFFGDGSDKCYNILSELDNVFFFKDIVPSAENMIPLSEEAFNKKQFEDVAYFEPFYLKDFVAGKKKGEK